MIINPIPFSILFIAFILSCNATKVSIGHGCSKHPCPPGSSCYDLVPEFSLCIAKPKPLCGGKVCKQGFKCQKGRCVSPIPPLNAACAVILCKQGDICVETPTGGKCVPNFPPNAGCAAVSCVVGNICIDTPKGGVCIPTDETPCGCLAVFDPVCCKLADGSVKTTGNDCECNGCNSPNQIISKGECPSDKPDEPCICTQEFDPVCCKSPDGSVRTAGNTCECTGCNSPNEIVSKGECPKDDACICTEEYDPVCCKTPMGRMTKSNKCFCECITGAKVLKDGECGKNFKQISGKE